MLQAYVTYIIINTKILSIVAWQLGAESPNDDFIYWRRIAFVAEQLNVDREKGPLHAVEKRMRAVAG
jgi:hypothetical protein